MINANFRRTSSLPLTELESDLQRRGHGSYGFGVVTAVGRDPFQHHTRALLADNAFEF
jgi:hypothetical protein